jgi:hypothetical protein
MKLTIIAKIREKLAQGKVPPAHLQQVYFLID